MSRTTIVEVAGGPGAGKSTDVSQIYAGLKRRGVNAEMAREVSKRFAYEGIGITALDELFILGAQIREESLLLGCVDVVVVDRPVFMTSVFADLYAPEPMRQGLRAAVDGYYETSRRLGHRRVVVLLPRRHAYVDAGRYEDEAGARRADVVVEQVVGEVADKHGIAGLYRFGEDAVGVEDVVVDVDRATRRKKR